MAAARARPGAVGAAGAPGELMGIGDGPGCPCGAAELSHPMPLHILKLCVGCDSIEDLEGWIAHRLKEARRAGRKPEHKHTTRMVPKRVEEILDGGSLYWVIRGNVQVRQRIIEIRPFVDKEGIWRCHLVLDPKTVPTEWQPRRAFQGWRYLKPEDAPRDLGDARAGLRSFRRSFAATSPIWGCFSCRYAPVCSHPDVVDEPRRAERAATSRRIGSAFQSVTGARVSALRASR